MRKIERESEFTRNIILLDLISLNRCYIKWISGIVRAYRKRESIVPWTHRMVHRGEGYNRGMTSEIDRSGDSLIELVKGTLFDETRLAVYHPLGYKDL